MNLRRVLPQVFCLLVRLAVVMAAIAVVVCIYHNNQWNLNMLARFQVIYAVCCAFLLDRVLSRIETKMRKAYHLKKINLHKQTP